MSETDAHRLTTVGQIRAIIGPEVPVVRTKLFESLDETSVEFIRRSPLLLLATSDREGRPDVSPKGDEPGFVAVEDQRTLLVPDRKGNKLIFGLQNILANPRVALIFLVPGTEETLRVHGSAMLTADPAVLERLSMRGQPALLAIRVRVDACFFHCAKAFKRSRLWQPASWPERMRISFGKMLAPRLGGTAEVERTIDRMIEEDYEKNL
jgi:PPOX class probable FMN-dependent enzyme